MDRIKLIFVTLIKTLSNPWQWISSVGITSVVSLLGGWDKFTSVLLFCVIADYVTGVAAARKEKKLNSKIGVNGIIIKILIFAIVALGRQLDILLELEQLQIRDVVAMFYIGNEIISILENTARIGLKVPAILLNIAENLIKEGDKDKEDKVEEG